MKLRTKILGTMTAIAAAGAVSMAAGSAGAVTPIGDLSTANNNQLFYGNSEKVGSTGKVNDIYNFSVSSGVFLTEADLINSLTENTLGVVTGGELFTTGSITIFSEAGGLGTALLTASLVSGTDSAGNPQMTANGGGIDLGVGIYSLDVSGTAGKYTGNNKLTYSGSLIGTAVPEPATWAVMLVGFGGIGASMRNSRRKQAATA